MILFLDFDGVLHPFPMGPDDKHLSAVASLWRILEKNPELSVVITSTWRERHTLEELVALLSANGGGQFKHRFVGVTPTLEGADYIPGVRQREIESWLANHAPQNAPYIILDDIEDYFDSNCRNLYLVDGSIGLTESDVEAVGLWLRGLT